MLLSRFKIAFAAGLSLLLWRCKNENKNQQKPPALDPNTNPLKESGGEAKLPTQPLDVITRDQNSFICGMEQRIPINTLAKAPEAFHIKYKAFGQAHSALIGMTIPLYQHSKNPIQTIYLCNEKGIVLSQRRFFPVSDLKPNRTMRPIIFEDVSLAKTQYLNFILVLQSQQTLVYSDQKPIDFYEEFEKLPVRSDRSDPSHRCNLFLYPNDNDFLVDEESDIVTPYTNKQISASTDLMECTITDAAGEVLSPTGQDFVNFKEYPLVIAYRRVGRTHYTRTIIRAC